MRISGRSNERLARRPSMPGERYPTRAMLPRKIPRRARR
jgi:hypothetical protein